MNISFDSLKLVNTCGAFGGFTKERKGLIFKASDKKSKDWFEIEFKCKPGAIRH